MTTGYRVLHTGSRALTAARYGHRAVEFVRDSLGLVWRPDATLITGAADGADTLAAHCWRAWGGTVELHPADWSAPCPPECPPHRFHRANGTSYCPAAGKRRNQHMVNLGADVCIALFAAGRTAGTAHCVNTARDAHIPIIERFLEHP